MKATPLQSVGRHYVLFHNIMLSPSRVLNVMARTWSSNKIYKRISYQLRCSQLGPEGSHWPDGPLNACLHYPGELQTPLISIIFDLECGRWWHLLSDPHKNLFLQGTLTRVLLTLQAEKLFPSMLGKLLFLQVCVIILIYMHICLCIYTCDCCSANSGQHLFGSSALYLGDVHVSCKASFSTPSFRFWVLQGENEILMYGFPGRGGDPWTCLNFSFAHVEQDKSVNGW